MKVGFTLCNEKFAGLFFELVENRAVEYADRTEIMNGIIKKYHPDMKRIQDDELEDDFIGIPEGVDIRAFTGEDEPTMKRSDTRGRKGLRTIPKHRRD